MELTAVPDFKQAVVATLEAGLALECDQAIKNEMNAIMA